ncbi:MAG TPA: NFACT RNA binding domain-containing protein [Myxococcales bacterium]|nr:NFACT RNA binding domain-containing protein [Myxococcales bacterium]
MRALVGAPLQKLWLPSPTVCVLQFRGAVVVLDARSSMAAIAPRRPTAPESAPTSQATLRNALSPARLSGAALLEGRRPRLDFETPAGPRWLVAEGALLLVDARSRRVLWASTGAQRRPGSELPEAAEIALGEPPALPQRDQLVGAALQKEEEAGLAARRRELVQRLRAQVQKLKRTLAAVDEDAARAAKAEGDRKRAELLLPLASRVPRGAREARVPDWSQVDAQGKPAEVTLELDPASSAADNAARWLKKAKRYQAAGARIAQRRAQVAAGLAQAEAALAGAQSAATAEQLARLELPAPPPRARQRAAERLPYRKYTSRSGAPVLVGRSARDNDALWKSARGNDLWLHARGVQGAHVVVPGAGDSPDPRTLADAALLAAHFSSARREEAAEVAWTRCKWVRKPRGAPPGSVQISQEKALRVRLDAARLAELLRTES